MEAAEHVGAGQSRVEPPEAAPTAPLTALRRRATRCGRWDCVHPHRTTDRPLAPQGRSFCADIRKGAKRPLVIFGTSDTVTCPLAVAI